MSDLPTIYPAVPNSPQTQLAAGLGNVSTTITVLDGSKLPDAPNLAVIGVGETSETILYTSKNGNVLSGVTRGFEGVASVWDSGTLIARNFTAYDQNSVNKVVQSAMEKVIESVDLSELAFNTADAAEIAANTAADKADEAAAALAAADNRYSNALTGVASGNPITISDVSPLGTLRRIAVVGNTMQAGVPAPDAPVSIGGVAPSDITVDGEQYTLSQWLYGDVNMDGVVDAADGSYLQQYLAGHIGLNATQRMLADVNGDGLISATDKIIIDRYAAGWDVDTYNTGKPSALLSLQGDSIARDEFDLVSGTETRAHARVIVSGSSDIRLSLEDTNTVRFQIYALMSHVIMSGSLSRSRCTHFPPFNVTSLDQPGVYTGSSHLYIRIPKTIASTVAQMRAWLLAQELAGTPVEFVYPIATPIITQHKPVSIVPTASEVMVSVDDGTLDVAYNLDINKAIAQLQNAVLNLGGSL